MTAKTINYFFLRCICYLFAVINIKTGAEKEGRYGLRVGVWPAATNRTRFLPRHRDNLNTVGTILN